LSCTVPSAGMTRIRFHGLALSASQPPPGHPNGPMTLTASIARRKNGGAVEAPSDPSFFGKQF